MTRFNIYRGTQQVGYIESADAQECFKSARQYVRTIGRSQERIEYPRGRVSVTVGEYRAVLYRRQS